MDARLTIILRGLRNTLDELLALDATAENDPADEEVTPKPLNAAEVRVVSDVRPAYISGSDAPASPTETHVARTIDGGVIPPTGAHVAESGPNTAEAPVELDSEGLPWDERIHSSGKTQYTTGANAGQWIVRRKTDPVYLAQIKSELRLKYPLTPTVPQVPAPPAPPVAEQPPAPPATMSWSELLNAIAGANPQLSPAEVQAACTKHGVANIGVLQDSPALVPFVASELGLA